MDYPSRWIRHAGAVMYVMAMCGIPKNEAQTFICQAISRRDVEIRCALRRHKWGSTLKSVLAGTDFDIPTLIKPKALDWEGSRPLKQWFVRRGGSASWGFWDLEWIEISWISLADIVRAAQEQGDIQYASSESPPVGPAPRTAVTRKPDAAGSGRRRGPRPKQFERVRDAMRNGILQGRCTVTELDNMLEKSLVEDHNASRDTVRKARKAVLSEFGELNSRQTPTNDK